MYHCWYTFTDDIRTIGAGIRIRIGGKIGQGEALIPFAVIGNDIQMIIENIDGIDERIDQVAALAGIVPIAFGNMMQEEQDAIVIHQLGLGLAEHFDGDAEVFRFIF